MQNRCKDSPVGQTGLYKLADKALHGDEQSIMPDSTLRAGPAADHSVVGLVCTIRLRRKQVHLCGQC